MFKSLLRRNDGSVFLIVALAATVVIGSVGVAVDIGRGQMVQAKLQNAVDAAGLAAGATLSTNDLTDVATKYVNLNFKQGNLGATLGTVNAVLSSDKKILTVTASADLPTTMMKIFGKNSVTVNASTEVTRSNKGLELALVLDITGSMCQPSCVGRLDALKTASNNLIDILFGSGNTTAENLWVGIVPFSMGVNVGPSHTDWLNASHYAALDWGTTTWRGCTEARWSDGNDLTDEPPSVEKFLAYYWQDDTNNNWREVDTQDVTTTTLCGPTSSNSCRCTTATGGYSGGTRVCTTTTSGTTSTRVYCTNQTSSNNRRCFQEVTTQHAPVYTYNITSSQGPNTYCPTNQVTRLTNQRNTLETAISGLTAVGGTHIPVGMQWGWNLLSPKWRGIWGGSMDTNSLPLDYNSPLMSKAVILMTDGQNTMYGTADGAYGYTGQNHTDMATTPYTDAKAAAQLDSKLTTLCNNMKANNIIVYTVLFDVDDANIKNLLRSCATNPDYFFDSPSEDALKAAFQTIGDSLANLRISK